MTTQPAQSPPQSSTGKTSLSLPTTLSSIKCVMLSKGLTLAHQSLSATMELVSRRPCLTSPTGSNQRICQIVSQQGPALVFVNILQGTDCDSYGYSDWAGSMNVQCWDTYDTSMQVYQDMSPANAVDRTWIWMTCNEPLFYWQTYATRT
jgi:hypothetical protein